MAAKIVRIGLVGAGGRMGARVIRLLSESSDAKLTSCLERDPDAVQRLQENVPKDVVVTDDLDAALDACDVLIDFSAPPASAFLGPAVAKHRKAWVVASTGIESEHQKAIEKASKSAPVLQAANLSIGVNILLELAQRAASKLGVGFDAEIFEIHHNQKRDAPSGTALALGDAVKSGREGLMDVHGRSGTGVRQAHELGISSARGGNVAGEHTVFFFGEHERVELTHRATSADIFATGAIRAALWLNDRDAGHYSMADVLST